MLVCSRRRLKKWVTSINEAFRRCQLMKLLELRLLNLDVANTDNENGRDSLKK